MYGLYEPPSPAGLSDDPERRAFGAVEVKECDDPNVPTEVVIVEREPKSGGVFHQLPFALTPGPPVTTTALRESIEATAAEIAAGLPQLPPSAVMDILLRCDPRTRSGTALPHGGDVADDVIKALLDLDSSYLAVHGPPGTGKTYTGGQDHRQAGRTTTTGGSVSSPSHTPSSRTCFATSSTAGVDRSRWPRRSTGPTPAGRRSTKRPTPAVHRRPCGLRDRRYRLGFRQRHAGARPVASTCWSSTKRASSASPTPSRWPARR